MSQHYRHYKTKGLYELIDHAILESTLEDVVIYQRISTGQKWVRPASEFFGNVLNSENLIVPRFEITDLTEE